ncbi:HAD-IIB family hydrolase [Marinobacter halodurans]|uniref:HAD-IIB family hydrolase n=1 Tax=Marinobacter halodurans TaxID=2528979 RepID=A0ABY1ZGD0_9GAMM|nr:HAD-IIB family hydrolase [Marinobacter halodurans]TBW50782.1 HAD-IIB family hydrolase [Marinobacter halodurans]
MSRLVIFTDLDGTLLDHHTYSAEPARPAWEAAQAAGVPCIFNTSKTRVEVEQLQEKLGLHEPFIVENGAAVWFPGDTDLPLPPDARPTDDLYCKLLSIPRTEILEALNPLRGRFRFRSLSDMAVNELMERTGLERQQAILALQREFSEPLVWMDSEDALKECIEALGALNLRLVRGGRFHHVIGAGDKGQAMSWLLAVYQKAFGGAITSVALGDSENDLNMLAAADVPFLVRSPVHAPPTIPDRPDVCITSHCGPEGWAEAVTSVLEQAGIRHP